MRDRTITEQSFDQRTQAYRGALASVSANEAAVRQAELDLEFTELRAPVAPTCREGDARWLSLAKWKRHRVGLISGGDAPI